MTPCQKLLKQEGTARRIESMQQSSATPKNQRCREGVAEDCCMLSILLAVPSCFNSFWHSVIHPTSFLMIFTLVPLIFSAISMALGSLAIVHECRSWSQDSAIYSACVIARTRALQSYIAGGGDVLLRMRHTHKMATNTSGNSGRALSWQSRRVKGSI